ncbi:hypothetical protein AYI70_g3700 [Smittium culicis]|uniref:Uncharacterized protein n=1 Tax=Smittium culicis TaxID=133412 RepID=A0A1R1Y2U7_9FUNG|nr:hypothetical protein AYI70_g3700 [Smittium culicis]
MIGRFIPTPIRSDEKNLLSNFNEARLGLVGKLLGGESKKSLIQLRAGAADQIYELETAKFLNGIRVPRTLILQSISDSPAPLNQCPLGHWKSECEALNKIISERKARKGNIKIGFVFKSSEAEISEVPADLSAESGQQIPKTKNNTYRPGDSEGYQANNPSSIDDIVAPNINSTTILRGTFGLKKPPAGVICHNISSHPPIIEDISKSDSIRDGTKIDVIPPKIMMAKKTVIYSDDYQESSDYEESSSPIRVKNEFGTNNHVQNSSDGNNTPSEHTCMAEKARLGKITQNQFLKYVSIVDRAPQGSNAANIKIGSELLGESFTDTEMSESPI